MNIVYFLLIGLVAGWLAGQLLKGKGFGLTGNLIIGCVGSLIGGLVFPLLGFKTTSLIGDLIAATIGAFILLAILGTFMIKRRR